MTQAMQNVQNPARFIRLDDGLFLMDLKELADNIAVDGELFISLSLDGELVTKDNRGRLLVYQARGPGSGTNNFDWGGHPEITFEFCSSYR